MLPAPRSLYLHVPFCPKVCPYCDFHKMHRHEGLVAQYLTRLEAEAKTLHAEFSSTLDTVYIGGGTPSHLTDAELTRITDIFQATWGWPATLETTLEADPLTFDKARLEHFRELGFNRLSIGLQSTQDDVLAFLGRRHNAREGLEAVELALAAHFEVSADLITAIDGQDTACDLHTLAATGVPHISVYNLTIEPYTPFAMRDISVDESKAARDFEMTNEILSKHGLERYEVSSHAKAGHASKHNQVYWQGNPFLNLGPSAAGFVPATKSDFSVDPSIIGERRTNPPIKTWLLEKTPEVDFIDTKGYTLDVLMTGLRTARGVDIDLLKVRTGIDLRYRYPALIAELQVHGLMKLENHTLKLTPAGLLQLNGIVRRFWQA